MHSVLKKSAHSGQNRLPQVFVDVVGPLSVLTRVDVSMGVDDADLQPLAESFRYLQDDSEAASMETRTSNNTVNVCSFGDHASGKRGMFCSLLISSCKQTLELL